MTREELVSKVDQYLGMRPSEIVVINNGAEAHVRFRSPTGVFLFNICLSRSTGSPNQVPEGHWYITGYGSLLYGAWQGMTDIHGSVLLEEGGPDTGRDAASLLARPETGGGKEST